MNVQRAYFATLRARAVVGIAESTVAARQLLVDQVTGSVRWRESVAWMAAQGVSQFWEIGAGKALSGVNQFLALLERLREWVQEIGPKVAPSTPSA